MKILGISCWYHDSAAALVADGRVVAAGAEERFSRRKHDNRFPSGAIQGCLETAGLTTRDIDYAIFYEKPFRKFQRILESAVATWPLSLNAFRQAVPIWVGEKLKTTDRIRAELGPRPRILHGIHHLSHAASAFYPSPFDRAVVLTTDGVGEWTTTSFGIGEGTRIRLDGRIRFPHSLGLYYSALTAYLGFRVNDDEWKVMGLASYGKPRYVDKFEKILRVAEDGSFRLDLSYFAHPHSASRMFTRKWERLLGRPARRGEEEELEEFHQDVARSGQEHLERTVVRMARALHERYACDDLCIAGGVGLNGVANWRILQETPFRRIFIQPAAGDDGGALGAALWAHHALLGGTERWRMDDAFLGPSYSGWRCRQALQAAGLPFRELQREEVLEEAARLVASGAVLGWYQGRMEFGPRALGNRSILADPRDPEMKAKINAKVKFREPFRPFAPSVPREDADRYFELGGREAPYMLLVPPVRPEMRKVIPAVTHVDGTGRVQTVERERNPLYYDLLRRFERRTGVPVVLNTSFNIRGEPIVCTPEDAIRTYLKSGIDALVLGRYVTVKEAGDAPRRTP